MATLRIKSLSDSKIGRTLFILIMVYIVAIQIPLLSPYRNGSADEIQIVDASWSVASGRSWVPASPLWSHIIPETGTFFAAYTPLYLYLLAFTLRILGWSLVAVGILHLVLRLAAASLYYSICRKMGNQPVVSIAFTALWATYAVGPVGRYEDLAVLFLLASVYVIVESKHVKRRFFLAGLFLGLTFMTYPGALGMLIPLTILVLFYGGERITDRRTLVSLGKNMVTVLGTSVIVAATWLFWIVPYWHEFKVHFLDFSLPDAVSPSYWKSMGDFAEYLAGGTLYSPVPLHFSFIPILVVLACLIAVDVKQNGFTAKTAIAISLLLAIALLTPRVRIHKTYNMIWFFTSALTLLPVFSSRISYPDRPHGEQRFVMPVMVSGLTAIVVLQLLGNLGLQGLKMVGDLSRTNACGHDPFSAIFMEIPGGDKVLTNQPYVFFRIRPHNPVFWPGGLAGETPGGIAFSSTYDDSFEWLILGKSLTDQTILQDRGPGIKFAWDAETLDYFQSNYSLVRSHDIQSCGGDRGLSRFSTQQDALFLYRYQP
jgi:hypothetical protein